jgi:hypothetical protein
MRALRIGRRAHEVGGEAVDLVTVFVAQLDAHWVDAVDAQARASRFVALAQWHCHDDVAALIAGELTDRTRDGGERRAELAVQRSLEERTGPKPLVDDDGDLTPRRCLLVEMHCRLESTVRRDPQVLRDEMQPRRARRVGLPQPVGAGLAAEAHDDGDDCHHREGERPANHSGTPAVRERPLRGRRSTANPLGSGVKPRLR